MIRKTHATVAGYRRVIFELPASLWADRVFVGNFNQGQPSRTPLSKSGMASGVRRLTCRGGRPITSIISSMANGARITTPTASPRQRAVSQLASST
jgi:hypothetical protein